MLQRKECIQEVANTIQAWDATQEEMLLARQLLSKIEKCGDHISITLTGKGVSAIAKVIQSHYGVDDDSLLEDEKADEDTLISKQDVKERFGVSDTTLWLWGKKNYLVPVKIGRKVMYRLSDIKRMVKGH
jgi:hypothetical protein